MPRIDFLLPRIPLAGLCPSIIKIRKIEQNALVNGGLRMTIGQMDWLQAEPSKNLDEFNLKSVGTFSVLTLTAKMLHCYNMLQPPGSFTFLGCALAQVAALRGVQSCCCLLKLLRVLLQLAIQLQSPQVVTSEGQPKSFKCNWHCDLRACV